MTEIYFTMVLSEHLCSLDLCSLCPPVCLIYGPPGTGKTTTLAAVVLSAVANGDKVGEV